MFVAPANSPAAGPVVPLLTQPDQAPAWAVRYGAEFWRREPADAAVTAPPPANGAVQHVPFSIADVMDRVHHALEADPQRGDGLPSVLGASYAAKFDGEGLRFSPHRPISAEPAEPDGNTAAVAARPLVTDADTEARVRTTSVQKDGEVFYTAGREPVEWTALGNTAQGLLSRDWGIVTHFEASAEGVEAAWVFSNPLPGAGLIEVAFSVEGLNYAGETESGHHFADASGTARVRVGQAFAVDAAGTRWELAKRNTRWPSIRWSEPSSAWTCRSPTQARAGRGMLRSLPTALDSSWSGKTLAGAVRLRRIFTAHASPMAAWCWIRWGSPSPRLREPR
jgi:hypothetical protein